MTLDRVLLIGTGGFGRCWWDALATHADELEVVAVVEPDDAEREIAGRHFDLPPDRRLKPGTGDWGAVDATLAVDSSPPWFHVPNALRAFDSGMDLIVAKPLAPSFAEAKHVVQAGQRCGHSVAVAQQMRYFPCFLALRQAIGARIAGRPRAVRVQLAVDGTGWASGTRWRLEMRHPLLLEGAIHQFDLLRWCLRREITNVTAVSWSPPRSPFSGDAAMWAVMSTEDGIPVAYDATWVPGDLPTVRFDSGWQVTCEDGVLEVKDGGLLLNGEVYGPAPGDPPVSLERLNARLIDAWLAARRRHVGPPCDGVDNLRSMLMLSEAMESVERLSGNTQQAPGRMKELVR